MATRSLLPAATAVALAAAAGAVLVTPAARADTPAGLTVAISDATHDPVTRGDGQETFILTVTNDAAADQPYTGELYALPTGGPSPVDDDELTLDVQPLTAPATDISTMGQNPGVVGQFFPQGGKAMDPFQVPAGTSYSWQVTVAFGADFPGNDDGLDVHVQGRDDPTVHFDLSPALPDGPFTEAFTHAVSVAPGKPGTTTLELDDQAGGSFTKPLNTLIETSPSIPGLSLDVRVGGTWTPVTLIQPGEWKLPQVDAGFARGQKHDYDLRFTVTGNPGSAKDLKLISSTWLGSPIADAQTTLHVGSAAPTTPPTTPATAGAPATTTAAAPTTSAASTSAAAVTADTGAPSVTPLAGSLAHTGGSSATRLLAGSGALIAGAGVALIAVVRRRRTAGARL